MEEVEERTEGPWAAVYGVVWHATALHFVLLLAFPTAGMIFAVDFATVQAVVLGVSLAIWGVTALMLIPVGLACLLRWLREAPAPGPLHDPWLDDQGRERT